MAKITRKSWSIREYEILESMVDKSSATIAAELKRNGFERNCRSINAKRWERKNAPDRYEACKLHAASNAEIEPTEQPAHEQRPLEAYTTEELVKELRARGCDVTCMKIVEY